MTSRTKRGLVVVAGVLLLAAIVAGSVARRNRSRVGVQTGEVARRDLVAVVTASGEVKPKRFVNVSANVSGRITHIGVEEGQRVTRGQILARIDSTRFEAGARQSTAAVQAARAELVRARADLESTRLSFERARRLREEQLISEEAFEQAHAARTIKEAAAQSQVERIAQLEAAAASQKDDLLKTTVSSPMDGVVIALQREEGEMVIGAQSFQPTVLMTIGDLSEMEVEVLVDETDIADLALDQTAEVQVDALKDVPIKGRVTEIGASALPRGATVAGQSTTNTANQAKDFKVAVTLDDPPASLKPGLNATVEITTQRAQQALAVPIQAVVVREVADDGEVIDPRDARGEGNDPDSEAPARRGHETEGVFVIENEKAHFRPVKAGIMGETDVEIREGLEEGQQIVTGSYRTLRTLRNEADVKPARRPKGK